MEDCDALGVNRSWMINSCLEYINLSDPFTVIFKGPLTYTYQIFANEILFNIFLKVSEWSFFRDTRHLFDFSTL